MLITDILPGMRERSPVKRNERKLVQKSKSVSPVKSKKEIPPELSTTAPVPETSMLKDNPQIDTGENSTKARCTF